MQDAPRAPASAVALSDHPREASWTPVLVVAGLLLAVLLVYAGRYGPHRDELYFAAAGRHLAWGYDDQGVLTPLLARVADLVAPGSVWALHLIPALAATAVVVLAALTAAELGGSRSAQLLTAVAVATGAVTVILGHMLSTATIDLVVWAAVVLIALRALVRDRPRLWLAVGVVAGVGLQNKDTVAFLLGALLVGVLLTPAVRHHLRTGWFWGGAAVAAALWLPDLLWQAAHGWPQATLAADIRAEYLTVGERANYVLLLLVLFGPLVTALWVYGLVRLWRVPALVAARPFAWAFAVLFVVFFVTGGKAYYLAGLLPVLVAAGAAGLAARWSRRGVVVATTVVALVAVAIWPAGLPILPARAFGASFYAGINEDQAETIGWPRLVHAVDSAAKMSGARAIVTQNYGEAGALDWYGAPAPVYSGHNSYADWGMPSGAVGPVVLVGFDETPDWAVGCRTVARVDDGVGVDNEEQGAPVDVCDGPDGSWASVWSQVRHLDA